MLSHAYCHVLDFCYSLDRSLSLCRSSLHTTIAGGPNDQGNERGRIFSNLKKAHESPYDSLRPLREIGCWPSLILSCKPHRPIDQAILSSLILNMSSNLGGHTADPENNLLQVPLIMQDHQKLVAAAMEEQRPSCAKVIKMAAAEMVGVFLIMFSTCGTAIADKKSNGDLTLLGFAIAGGLSVMMMVFAVGHISGAHLNPAITLAFASKKLFPLHLVPVYVFAQFVGALAAAGVLQALMDDAEASLTLPYAGTATAFVVELILGFNLMFVATAVSNGSRNSGELAGIAVGATVILNVLLAGTISGASMNPMRSLGPAIVANKYDGIWIYLVAPPLGALAGTWTHTLLHITP